MASAILHIKDSYYFEVPKRLWPRDYGSKADFPTLWVQLDPDFQLWEADRLYDRFKSEYHGELPAKDELIKDYLAWKHLPANEGKPFDRYLEEHRFADWFSAQSASPGFASRWRNAKDEAGGERAVKLYQASADPNLNWSPEKIDAYNHHLSGKILIPQPFGTLRNFYERESGFCISKFMLIQLAVGLILWIVFAWLASCMGKGASPRGRLWNLLEAIVVYIRDYIARPAIGSHDADRFVPLLLTIFFFILGCNLFGMLPWMGAPTGSWGVTLAMAGVTLAAVVVSGVRQFGVVGFFLNQIPHMDLPLPLAIVLKPMILVIELFGLLIKHLILSIRLLANMVAGHIVLLAILTLAFSVEGAASAYWGLVAPISVIGATLISLLELFVAFLQAFIFTFLSALFIGAAIHHH